MCQNNASRLSYSQVHERLDRFRDVDVQETAEDASGIVLCTFPSEPSEVVSSPNSIISSGAEVRLQARYHMSALLSILDEES